LRGGAIRREATITKFQDASMLCEIGRKPGRLTTVTSRGLWKRVALTFRTSNTWPMTLKTAAPQKSTEGTDDARLFLVRPAHGIVPSLKTAGASAVATLEQIQARLKKLQAQADAIVAKQSSTVLEKIRSLMEKHGLTHRLIHNFQRDRRHVTSAMSWQRHEPL
jgi:hypothetical protein